MYPYVWFVVQLTAMNTRRIIVVVTISGITVLLFWFAYYAISPLFRNVKVDEALPVEKQMGTQPVPESQTQTASAQVIGTAGHPASGTARVIEADGKRYVRYENFKTINGPDLYVYLAKDLDAKEYVNLGTLRATEGNVNYEVPPGLNLAEYPYVMTWCKQFSVLFNYAEITSALPGS